MRILYVIHGRILRESRVADRLLALGAEVEFCNSRDGDPVPESPRGFDAVVVGGGPESVNEAAEKPYIAREIALARASVAERTPYLGLCLGGQILAAAHGAPVGPRPDGRCECGWHALEPTAEGRALFGGLDHVYSFHYEGFAIPEGGVRLAGSADFPNHAFRFGASAYGLQFHPDCRPDIIPVWYGLAHDMVVRPGAQPLDRQLALAAAHDAAMSAWLDRFLVHWLAPAAVAA